MTGDVDFLVREHRGEIVERNTVADVFRKAAVDLVDFGQREIFLAGLRRTDSAIHRVAVFLKKLSELKQTPLAVQVHYKEYKHRVPWRGETKYIVTAIDTVTINEYIDNIKDIPLPPKPQTPGEPEKGE